MEKLTEKGGVLSGQNNDYSGLLPPGTKLMKASKITWEK